jgi:O-antigen ligase
MHPGTDPQNRMINRATPPRRSHSAAASLTRRTPADALALALGGAILTYVWRVQDLYPILNSIKFPILTSLLALGLYIANQDRRRALRTIQKHPVTKVVLFILALAVLSVPTSIHQGMSFHFITDDYGKNVLLMLILAASVRSFADVERYGLCLVLGGIAYAYFVYTKVEIGASGRLDGGLIYYDANDLGMLLVCSLPIALYFLMRGKKALVRLAALVALGLFVLVIIQTGSRGAFLGLISLGLYLLLQFNSVASHKRILVVGLGTVALMTLGGDRYWAMMKTLLHPESDYNWSGGAESGRMEVWKRGMGYMFTHPILGVGVDAFPIAEGTLSPLAARQELGIGLKWSAAHNSFVQIGAELGIMGLLAFCLLLARCYRTLRKAGNPPGPPGRRPTDEQVFAHALGGSVVSYAVSGFFLSQAYGAIVYTLFGIIVGLSKVTSADRPPVGEPAGSDFLLRSRKALAPRSATPATAGLTPVPAQFGQER